MTYYLQTDLDLVESALAEKAALERLLMAHITEQPEETDTIGTATATHGCVDHA